MNLIEILFGEISQMNIANNLEIAARFFPEQQAIIEGDRVISYSEFNRTSSHVAAGLIAHGLMPGDPVAFCAPNSAEWLIFYFGVLKAGAVTVTFSHLLTRDELAKLAYWKAPRSAGHIQRNTEDYVREITGFALSARSERARIEVLTNLDGVGWPTASVVLHFFHQDPYPIMDFRALWSVSLEVPTQYDFDFWWEYVRFCRDIAQSSALDMRTLDRALWQYSKENQERV